jgi:hypothetical protein
MQQVPVTPMDLFLSLEQERETYLREKHEFEEAKETYLSLTAKKCAESPAEPEVYHHFLFLFLLYAPLLSPFSFL